MKKFPSFMKVSQNKRFTFTPRYFDPEKEEREQRIAQIESEVTGRSSGNVQGYQYRISQSFRKKRKDADRGTIMIRLFIVVLLLTLFFLYFGY